MASEEWISEWQKRFMELLQEAGAADAECPVCESAKNIALPFVTAPWSEPPGKPFNPKGLHLLPVVCMKCKHVRFFLPSGWAAMKREARKRKSK